MIFEENMLVREKNFFTYYGLIMITGQYAKRVANKTNGLVDITLFSLTPNIFYNAIHTSFILTPSLVLFTFGLDRKKYLGLDLLKNGFQF